MASALHGEESQWAHLLQPIKDMAANWDINIAHELEDYLVRRRRIRAPLVAMRLAWLPVCRLRFAERQLPCLCCSSQYAARECLCSRSTALASVMQRVAAIGRIIANQRCAAQEELEHITFSFEGGPTLNFAEGATRVAACLAAQPPLSNPPPLPQRRLLLCGKRWSLLLRILTSLRAAACCEVKTCLRSGAGDPGLRLRVQLQG